MPAVAIPLTGSVLDWALHDAGWSTQDAAAALEVQPSTLTAWVKESDKPNRGQFRRLAKLLNRPESFFFLPAPPQSQTFEGVAYRTLGNAEAQPSAETRDGLSQAQRAQALAEWLNDKLKHTPASMPRVSASSDKPAGAARKLAEWLSWDLENQTSASATDTSAAKALREALQLNGLIVMHLTLEKDIVRGFSLSSSSAPLIAVNTRDHTRARLFSYVHELAHLAIHDSSICLTRNDLGVERFCNRVAAAFLMPADAFRDYKARRWGSGYIDTEEQIIGLRNYFKVSLQAAAIRAEHLDLARPGLYEELFPRSDEKSRGGAYQPGNERTRPVIRYDQYGSRLMRDLLAAERSGDLSQGAVQSLLRISDSEFRTLRRLAGVSGMRGNDRGE